MADFEGPRPLRAYPGVAWAIIALLVIASMVATRLPEQTPRPSATDGGAIMEVQAKILTGGASLGGERAGRMYVRQVDELNTGALGQRQRAIVLLAELGGPDVAADRVAELDDLLDENAHPDAERPVELTANQQRVQELLRLLYLPDVPGARDDVERPRVELLDGRDRDLLVAELGWFGELALVPRGGPDPQAREALLRGPMFVAVFATVVVIGLVLLGLAGAVGLIVLVVFAVGGRLGCGVAPGSAPHGIYAETFAMWMGMFIGLQVVVGFVAQFGPQHALFLMFIAFFASLTALAWPVMRGVPWSAVKHDVGLSFGRRPVVEGGVGIGGYFMALPIFGVGVVFVIVFAAVHGIVTQATGEPRHPFDPEGMPAHPAFDMIVGPNLWPKIQLLLVATIAAPIVEEIMFRGVLYRHVRDALRPSAAAGLSILGSAAVTGLIFAVIHPVPWFAWPALMALAIAFALAREWRGSIVPSILMHAIHNGVIVTSIVIVLGA